MGPLSPVLLEMEYNLPLYGQVSHSNSSTVYTFMNMNTMGMHSSREIGICFIFITYRV